MNRRAALAVALVLAAGVGGWALWGNRLRTATPERVGGADGAADAPGEAIAPEAVALAAGGHKVDRPHEGAPAPVDGAADPVGRAEGSAPKGRGLSLRGRVVWRDDETPVAGARVTLAHVEPIAVALRIDTRDRADSIVVRTDAQGRFEFTDIRWAQEYTFAARGPSGPITRWKVAQMGADARAEVVLRLAKSGTAYRGFVHDAAGAPIAGARVVVGPEVNLPQGVVLADPERLPEKDAETQTDEKGRFGLEDVPDGPETLVVTGPSGAREILSPVLNRTDIDILLAPSLGIGGRVLLANGAPAPGLRVVAKSVSRAALFDAVTGEDGTFQIVGPSRGPHVVLVLHPTLGGQLVGAFPAGYANVRFTLPEGGALETRVLWKRDGSPVTDFRWILEPLHEEGEQDGRTWVEDAVLAAAGTTRARTKDGVLRVEPLRAGKYLLRVYVEGHERVDSPILEVPSRGERKADPIEIPESRRISGVVRRANGTAVEGARVLWLPEVPGQPEAPEEDLAYTFMDDAQLVGTDVEGRFVCEPVAPGDYRVVAVPGKGRPASLGGVHVGASDVHGLELVVPASATLRVRVLTSEGTPAANVRFLVAQEGGAMWIRASGAALAPETLEDLRPGTYAVAWLSLALGARLNGAAGLYEPGAAYAALASVPALQTVELAAGQDLAVDVTLPRLVRLRAHLHPPAGVSVSGRTCLLGERRARVDDHETAEFDLLEPGPSPVFVFTQEGPLERPLQALVTVPDVPFAEVDVTLVEQKR